MTYPENGGYITVTTDSLNALYDKRDELMGEKPRKVLFSDMDGVLEPDDLALTYWGLLDPEHGEAKFRETSDAVLVPAGQGRCPYGFTLVVIAKYGPLYEGVLRAVGRNVRLTPGAEMFARMLKEAAVDDVVATTCAYDASAEEVCKRVGINEYSSIEFDADGRLKVFIGGKGKTKAAREWLGKKNLPDSDAFVLGDSWTDFNIVQDFRPGSVMFNPKYPEINVLASANVYSPDLRGVVQVFDVKRTFAQDTEITPEWVVFRGEKEKPEDLVREEMDTAKRMRERIASEVEAGFPRSEMLRIIRESEGLGKGAAFDMSEMDVSRCVETVIERHAEFLQALKS